jgi:hypothetical protein
VPSYHWLVEQSSAADALIPAVTHAPAAYVLDAVGALPIALLRPARVALVSLPLDVAEGRSPGLRA